MQIESARAAAKKLNEVCGTNIKINFVKSKEIDSSIVSEISGGLEDVPEDVMEYYNSISPNLAEELEAEKDAPRWSMEKLTELANDAGFEIEEGLNEDQIADGLLDFVDGLDEDTWMRLPKSVKDWNVEAIAVEQEVNATAKTSEKIKETVDEKPPAGNKLIDKFEDALKEKEKKPSRKRLNAKPARPDFQFNKGTSGRQIMDFFNSIVDDRGIKLKEFIEICSKQDIKSSNVESRIRSVIGYSLLEEGGKQVIKHNGILYKKGNSPLDGEGKGE